MPHRASASIVSCQPFDHLQSDSHGGHGTKKTPCPCSFPLSLIPIRRVRCILSWGHGLDECCKLSPKILMIPIPKSEFDPYHVAAGEVGDDPVPVLRHAWLDLVPRPHFPPRREVMAVAFAPVQSSSGEAIRPPQSMPAEADAACYTQPRFICPTVTRIDCWRRLPAWRSTAPPPLQEQNPPHP